MLILDTECYSNYFLIAFLDTDSGKTRTFRFTQDTPLDTKSVKAIMGKYITMSFNGNSYDLPMITAALSGFDNAKLKALSDAIIKSKLPSYKVCANFGIRLTNKWDHIDIIEIPKGQSSLKIYAGRIGTPTLQDLPYHPDEVLTSAQMIEVEKYCINDLRMTQQVYQVIRPQIELRESMSKEYGLDLRSKSDAQIAEAVIISELSAMTKKKYSKPSVDSNQTFRYQDPQIVSFKNKDLQQIFKKLLKHEFTLGSNGAVQMPDWLKDAKIDINATEYQMGIGGLHSCENAQYIRTCGNDRITDFDVASYYPSIILQQKLAPAALGAPFLRVYQSIVSRRLKAKHEGDKVVADTLKICVNGSFGKLGSKYSTLYAPELLIQTTITGQLCLLMLIERMEAIGAEVMSANTDGIVVYYDKSLSEKVQQVAWDWMLDTSYELEETEYRAIASRDVNNYVAVKTDGKLKLKGCFAPPSLEKNPDSPIIYQAVAQYIASETPLEDTIKGCKDILQFCTVRRVQGGGVWNDEHLGKAVRFYHSNEVPVTTCIRYATNSNTVPNSQGARPLMVLPEAFPKDVDYAWYIEKAEKLLAEVGI